MKRYWNKNWGAWLLCAIAFFLAFCAIKYAVQLRQENIEFQANQEADEYCYDRVDHVREMAKFGTKYAAEYVAMIPMMDKFAKDKILTVRECERLDKRLDGIYKDNKQKEKIEKLL